MESKVCTKCKEDKPLAEYGKDKHKKDGHRSACKTCLAESKRQSARRYYAKNRDQVNERSRSRWAANADEINAQRRDRRQTDEEYAKRVREQEREHSRRRMADPAMRRKQKEAVLRWYAKNKPAYRAAWAKYKAARVSQTPSWANEQLIAAYYKEAKRLEELTGIKFHVDHIIPLQGELVSGLHVETNLQLLPAHENLGKSNSFDPETFCA